MGLSQNKQQEHLLLYPDFYSRSYLAFVVGTVIPFVRGASQQELPRPVPLTLRSTDAPARCRSRSRTCRHYRGGITSGCGW